MAARPRILIVGAGPTGLAAALFLAERGIKARIIETKTERSHHSKALVINPRSLNLLRSTGVTDTLVSRGYRLTTVNLHRNLKRVAQVQLAPIDPAFPFLLALSQARSEVALEQALADHGIAVERGVSLEALSVSEEGVTCTLTTGTEQADYVLGADGAHSTVREQCGISFDGDGFAEPWKLYDVRLRGPLDPEQAHVFLFDEGGMFVIRVEDDVWRVIGSLPAPLAALPPDTELGEIVWESDFHIGHRVARQFSKGRVFLAGDAAHIHSPVGGRGMNLGIEDAYVFAALAAAGRLDRYADLRRPVVRRFVNQVRRATEIPRGKTVLSRFVRPLMPVLAPILMPLVSRRVSRWVMGLDHPVGVDSL